MKNVWARVGVYVFAIKRFVFHFWPGCIISLSEILGNKCSGEQFSREVY